MRYHIHGTTTEFDEEADGAITITVNAEDDGEAQNLAWRLIPSLDIDDIEVAE